ncbi:MAG TPA: hypothetical protein VH054_09175, partial [Polyangiaceae bacterium]|nr:hypothetical protein [Polyangiaceae bacterium]
MRRDDEQSGARGVEGERKMRRVGRRTIGAVTGEERQKDLSASECRLDTRHDRAAQRARNKQGRVHVRAKSALNIEREHAAL